jgi:hypothetical protein
LAGALWATPTILIAKPSEGATLSFGPTAPLPQPAGNQLPAAKPLAFTGDNTEQDALFGVGLIAAGWLLTRWQAGEAR